MRKYLLILLFGLSSASAQEQTGIMLPEESAAERCLRIASELGLHVKRCRIEPWGRIYVFGENLGSIDFMSAVVSWGDQNRDFSADLDLLTQGAQAFLESLRPLMQWQETPTVRIVMASSGGDLEVHQLLYGYRVRHQYGIEVDPLTGRVTRLSGSFKSSSDVVSPPSEEWVREQDAIALAKNAAAAYGGSIVVNDVLESELQWESTPDGLRPQWWLTLRTSRGSYRAMVDALTGEAQAGPYN